MTRVHAAVLALVVAGAVASLTLTASAQNASFAASCMTVAQTEAFAPQAEAWMRAQQRAGAREFVAVGNTMCAY